MNGVIATSIGTAVGLYLLVAFTGYISYGTSLDHPNIGDNVSGNIISMYKNSAAATFGRAAIVVLMLFSYPLQAHPCRGSLDKVFAWRPGRPAPIQVPVIPKGGPSQMRYYSYETTVNTVIRVSRY
jgi:hypothetical protein